MRVSALSCSKKNNNKLLNDECFYDTRGTSRVVYLVFFPFIYEVVLNLSVPMKTFHSFSLNQLFTFYVVFHKKTWKKNSIFDLLAKQKFYTPFSKNITYQKRVQNTSHIYLN